MGSEVSIFDFDSIRYNNIKSMNVMQKKNLLKAFKISKNQNSKSVKIYQVLLKIKKFKLN